MPPQKPAPQSPVVEPTALTWGQFHDRFRPKKNHLDPNAPFDGCMYETYGAERAFVEQINAEQPLTVWTVVEDDDGRAVAVDGLHWVNRLGFIVTEVPRALDEPFMVADDD
jgi:hypothetical protein